MMNTRMIAAIAFATVVAGCERGAGTYDDIVDVNSSAAAREYATDQCVLETMAFSGVYTPETLLKSPHAFTRATDQCKRAVFVQDPVKQQWRFTIADVNNGARTKEAIASVKGFTPRV